VFFQKEFTFQKIYLTTTLPYANSVPHVGHAIEFLQADAYARFFRRKFGSHNVFFNVGVDEHGLKILTTARDLGKEPSQFLDELVPKWNEFCSKFNISNNHFYRTSTPDHHAAAQRVWQLLRDKGDIYKKHYKGLYCIGCESFLVEKDLVDGRCPHHNAAPVEHAEENYFLKLSKNSNAIVRHLQDHPSFLKPSSKLAELTNFVREMEDISISRMRTNLPWGVQVPDDPAHTMYVWFDALINYINVLGFDSDMANFNEWWPGVQFCGPDNLRFQGAIWQGMLAGLGLPFTSKLLVHGTILGPDGQKMSKTLGNVVAPLDQYDKYGCDVIRYYMLGVLKTYGDSSYREEELKTAYNAQLANNYGNLLNRLIHLANQKSIDILNNGAIESDFRTKVLSARDRIERSYEDFELFDAVSGVFELISFGNQYVHEKEPWKLQGSSAEVILNNISFLLRTSSELLEPVMPEAAGKALRAIVAREKIILFPRM
jgi:methionyl-tRNA synthetase